MIVYESDLKRSALSAIENCIAYLNAGDMKKAHQCFGEAKAYEDILFDEGIDMQRNDYYNEMRSIYLEKGAENGTQH